MANKIDKQTMLDLIIEAKKTDPEAGPFSEWLTELGPWEKCMPKYFGEA